MAQWEALYHSLVLWGKGIRLREEGAISIQQRLVETPGAGMGRGQLRAQRGQLCEDCSVQVSRDPGIALHRLDSGFLTCHCLHRAGRSLQSGSTVPSEQMDTHRFLLGTRLYWSWP